MLVTRPPGYQLRAAPGQVDAGCFEEALAAGRAALPAATRRGRRSWWARGWHCGGDRH